MDGDVLENGGVQSESSDTGNLRVHPHAGEHIPSAHGSEVVIAREAVDCAAVLLVDYTVNDFLRFPGLPNPVVSPGNLETRLVAAGIPFVAVACIQAAEKIIKTLFSLLRATGNLYESCDIIRHHPEIVGIGRFTPVIPLSAPTAVGIARAQPAGLGVDKVLPRIGNGEITPAKELVADGTQCELPYGEISRRVFQLDGSIVVALVEILLQPRAGLHILRLGPGLFRTLAHDVEQRFGVVVAGTESPCVGNQNRRGVTLHHSRLDIGHDPARECTARLFGKLLMRNHHIGGHLRLQHRQKLDLRAVGVPVAERRVLFGMCLMNLVVGTHVFTVHVTAYVRVNQHVIQMGIELCDTVGIGAFHLYTSEAFVPTLLGSRTHSREIPSGILGLEILAGILHRDI